MRLNKLLSVIDEVNVVLLTNGFTEVDRFYKVDDNKYEHYMLYKDCKVNKVEPADPYTLRVFISV